MSEENYFKKLRDTFILLYKILLPYIQKDVLLPPHNFARQHIDFKTMRSIVPFFILDGKWWTLFKWIWS